MQNVQDFVTHLERNDVMRKLVEISMHSHILMFEFIVENIALYHMISSNDLLLR